MQDCKPTKIPLSPNHQLKKSTATPLVDPTLYRSMVGKLVFLTNTRPDIAFSVNLVSRYMDKPEEAHLQAVKSILRYIKGTTTLGLLYKKGGDFTLTGYTDADWGGDLDERKSTGAFIFTVGNTPISWSSRKQTCVSLSSTESEYRSLVETCKEAIWIQNLYTELGYNKGGAVTIHCDNMSTIKISKNPIYHSRTKHFEIHLHFVRDMVKRKRIQVLYLPTDEMPADTLTKALNRTKFENCRRLLNLKP
jgi:hypothetical protein